MKTPRARTIRVRGLGLGVLEWGDPSPDRPTVVILHGWLDQALAWSRVADELVDRGRHVVAWDHRGHGASDHGPLSSGYHFPEYVADVDGAFDALQLDGAKLVGHSMGGTIAGLFAGLRPARISGLVLVDGLGPPAKADADAADQMVAFLDAQAHPPESRVLGGLESAVARIRRVNPTMPPALALALARRGTRSDGHGGVRWAWDPRHRTRSAVSYDEDRHKLILERVEAPVQLVYGRTGWYLGIAGLPAREAALAHVVARHELDCGHSVHLEEPERLAELIDRA